MARREKQREPPKPERPMVPVHLAIRMFFIGAIAVVAAAYALYRHYSVPVAPMLVPAPPSASAAGPDDEGTIPVDLEEAR